MRETEFIKRNEEKWQRYERALQNNDQDPELLKQLYIHTTDDLSYSRTFYPNRSVRVYLNGLAQKTFLQIYKGRRGETSRFFSFWTDELPRVVYAQRRPMLIALVTAVLAVLIGIISYRIDSGFAEVIMGERYMNMTQANIEKGDPMAVYKQMSPFSMSMRITLNNIFVALRTFVAGAFFAVGSIVEMIRFGVMLGTFQYFFYDKGIFLESFLTIWIHGALEISSIIIAGGAGLAMGKGLLFPGTLSRFAAFKASARDGLKIMLGLIPLFIIAGFLEGYMTRHTELPDAIRAAFILLCVAFIVWYYIIYPRAVARRPDKEQDVAPRDNDTRTGLVSLRGIRPAGDNMTDTFTILRHNTGLLFGGLAAVTFGYCFSSFFFYDSPAATRYFFDGSLLGDFHNVHELLTSFSRERSILFLLFSGGALYGLLRLAFEIFWRATGVAPAPSVSSEKETSLAVVFGWLFKAFRWLTGMKLSSVGWKAEAFLYLICLGIALSFAFSGIVAGLVAFLTLPFLMTFAYAGYSGLASPKETFRYVYTNLITSYGNFLLLLLMAVPLMWVLDTGVAYFLFAFLDWVFYADAITIDNANVTLQAIVYFFLFGLLFISWSVSFALNFYTLREIEKANTLLEDIDSFGSKRRLRGMEVE